MAEPGSVAQVFIAEPGLTDKFQLNAVVSLIDAEYVLKQLDMSKITGLQIGFADILVLNKIDRADDSVADGREFVEFIIACGGIQ